MASFWRPGYDPRRRTLPAIAEDSEEENAALLPTTHAAGPSHAPPNERDREASDETGSRGPSAADAGPSGSEILSTQRQEDDSTTDQEPLTRKERLARRLARQPDFRPHPRAGHAEEEVRLRLLGVMHVLAEVRAGVGVLRERIARRGAAIATQPPAAHVREPGELTYEDVERFVQVAAAEDQRRFSEP